MRSHAKAAVRPKPRKSHKLGCATHRGYGAELVAFTIASGIYALMMRSFSALAFSVNSALNLA